MFEYAITAGEGILIDYGVVASIVALARTIGEGETLIVTPCDNECKTGE